MTYDKSSIHEVCGDLEKNNYQGIVVLKSTVEPTTTVELAKKYNLKFVHNPEFFSQTARSSQYRPNLLVDSFLRPYTIYPIYHPYPIYPIYPIYTVPHTSHTPYPIPRDFRPPSILFRIFHFRVLKIYAHHHITLYFTPYTISPVPHIPHTPRYFSHYTCAQNAKYRKCATLGLSHRGAPGRAWVSAASYMFFSGATRAAPFFLSQNAGVCLIALPIATRVAKLRASFETLVDAVRSSDRSRGASCDRQCSAGCAMTAETAVSGLSACCSV